MDTGACGVYLHLNLARQLYGEEFPSQDTETTKCIVANDYVEETYRGNKTTLQIQGRSISIRPFVMETLSYKGIIGYQTLSSLGFLVDTVNHKLVAVSDLPVQSSIDDPVVAMSPVETDDIGEIQANIACSIAPMSARLIPGLLKGESQTNEFCLLQQLGESALSDGLIVVSSLATMKNSHVDVFILNTTGDELDIKKGTRVASAVRIDHRPQCGVSALTQIDSPQMENSLFSLRSEKKSFLEKFTISEDLTPKQMEKLRSFLWKERSLFSTSDFDIGRFKGIKHTIDTGNERPYRETLRRHSPKTREDIKVLVKEMLEHGIIQPSFSPWSSAPVLVQKKSGGKRFAIDYRGVNAKTLRDSFPLPQIADSLDAFAGAAYFSTLDLTQGFWQIELDEESKPKTAFTTPQGLYEFRVMPFGLCNSPATFQRAMQCCLEGLNWEIALCFLDDIIVFSRTFEEHIERLQKVFNRLREHNLKLKPKKCEFFKTEVTYLGHKVSSRGISTDPRKIEAIKNWERPKTVSQLRSFIGLAQYYRRFVKDFSLIASPLHDQVKKDRTTISWGPEQEDAFLEIKKRLSSTPIIKHPDFQKPFIVDTDASLVGIGCVLSQVIDGREHVIAYNSRKFSKQERKWSATDREFFSLYIACRLFRSYLYGRSFTLRTDHQALLGLLRKAKDLCGKQSRWWAYLSNFDYKLVYRQGSSHGNADGLSRQTQFLVDDDNEVTPILNSLSASPAEPIDIKMVQQGDPMISLIKGLVSGEVKHIPSNEMDNVDNDYWKYYVRHKNLFSVKHDILMMEKRAVIPRSALPALLFVLHDSPLAGHLGRNRTWQIVQYRFWWPNSFTDVKDYIRSCQSCQARKGNINKKWAPLNPSQTMDYPFQRIAMDIFQMPRCNGYELVLVVVDYFSKWVEAFPLRNKSAETIAEILFQHIFMRHGPPEYLHSDKGAEFVASIVHELSRVASVYQTHTPAYSPRADGQAERQIRTLKDMLSKYHTETGKWFPYLYPALCAIRSSVHETIGFSPYEVLYGRQPRLMADLQWGLPSFDAQRHPSSLGELQARLRRVHSDVKERQTLASERMKERYDASKKVSAHVFKPGDFVWVSVRPGPRPKLLPRWDGPFLVKDVNEVGSIYIRRSGQVIKTAQDRCKLYTQRPSHLQSKEYREAFVKSTVDYKCDPPALILDKIISSPSESPVSLPSFSSFYQPRVEPNYQENRQLRFRRQPMRQPVEPVGEDGSAASRKQTQIQKFSQRRFQPQVLLRRLSESTINELSNPQVQVRIPPSGGLSQDSPATENEILPEGSVAHGDGAPDTQTISEREVLEEQNDVNESTPENVSPQNVIETPAENILNEDNAEISINNENVVDSGNIEVNEVPENELPNVVDVEVEVQQVPDNVLPSVVDNELNVVPEIVESDVTQDVHVPPNDVGFVESHEVQSPATQRTSGRLRRPPMRLGYDQGFKQVSAIGHEVLFWLSPARSLRELGITLFGTEDGLCIRRLIPGSLAESRRLCNPGDLLIAINNQPVKTVHDLIKCISHHDGIVSLTVRFT